MRNLILILAFAVAAVVSTLIVPFIYLAPKALGCRINPDPSAFLTYCNGANYEDYEHGAYYWNLEPEATKSMVAARVLFLGNSRVQFGFSTEATRGYFEKQGAPFYLAGFTYFENMVFIQRLIAQYDLSPDIIIVNADGTFFQRTAALDTGRAFRVQTREAVLAHAPQLLAQGRVHPNRKTCLLCSSVRVHEHDPGIVA